MKYDTSKKIGFISVIQKNLMQIFTIVFIISVICIYLFYKMIFGTNGELLHSSSDFSLHIKFLIKGATGGGFLSYPLYHVLIYLLSLGSTDFVYLSFLSVIVLTCFIILKVLISYFVINEEIQTRWKALIISIVLIFTMPILNWWGSNIYLGQLTPNVWHNPTTIAAMPFAIILFYYTYRRINTLNLKNYFVISGLVTINLICKPNYLIAFLPAFIMLLLYRFIKNRDFKILKGITIISVSSLLVLACQFVFTYGDKDSTSGIMFAPFVIWSNYSPNVLASLFLSVAFPLVYTILYFSKVRINKSIIFSWSVFIIAMLQFSFLAETGARQWDANFAWGCYISLYILFLTTAIDFFKQKVSARYIVVITILSLHLLSGFIYYHKIISGMGYA